MRPGKPKNKRPRNLAVPGQTWGWELATLSSRSHTLGALAFGGPCAPRRHSSRPCEGFSLMAGPSRPLQPESIE